jgi:hypothetical protein
MALPERRSRSGRRLGRQLIAGAQAPLSEPLHEVGTRDAEVVIFRTVKLLGPGAECIRHQRTHHGESASNRASATRRSSWPYSSSRLSRGNTTAWPSIKTFAADRPSVKRMIRLKVGCRQPRNRGGAIAFRVACRRKTAWNGWDEPCKLRGLRTVLWAAGGEIPPADLAA